MTYKEYPIDMFIHVRVTIRGHNIDDAIENASDYGYETFQPLIEGELFDDTDEVVGIRCEGVEDSGRPERTFTEMFADLSKNIEKGLR